MDDKVLNIAEQSKGLKEIAVGTSGMPTVDMLLYHLYNNSYWNRDTSAELWLLLGAMQEYAFKYDIKDFYEMILRFTLSECFGEDYDG